MSSPTIVLLLSILSRACGFAATGNAAYSQNYGCAASVDQAAYESAEFWKLVAAEIPGFHDAPELARYRGWVANLITKAPGECRTLDTGQEVLTQYVFPGLQEEREPFPRLAEVEEALQDIAPIAQAELSALLAATPLNDDDAPAARADEKQTNPWNRAAWCRRFRSNARDSGRVRAGRSLTPAAGVLSPLQTDGSSSRYEMPSRGCRARYAPSMRTCPSRTASLALLGRCQTTQHAHAPPPPPAVTRRAHTYLTETRRTPHATRRAPLSHAFAARAWRSVPTAAARCTRTAGRICSRRSLVSMFPRTSARSSCPPQPSTRATSGGCTTASPHLPHASPHVLDATTRRSPTRTTPSHPSAHAPGALHPARAAGEAVILDNTFKHYVYNNHPTRDRFVLMAEVRTPVPRRPTSPLPHGVGEGRMIGSHDANGTCHAA
jgi:hypothetical protein